MKFLPGNMVLHVYLGYYLLQQHNIDFFDLSAGCNGGGEGGGEDGKLAGEEEQQQLENGGP
jgi:hypothetical protein